MQELGWVEVPVGAADQEQEGTDTWYELEGGGEGLLHIRTQWRPVDGEDWVELPEVWCLCALLSCSLAFSSLSRMFCKARLKVCMHE